MANVTGLKSGQTGTKHINIKIPTSGTTPVNAVAAVGTLTLGGVVVDGDTCTIDTDVYEFAADAAQTVTSGNTAVDITSYVTASSGTLTVDTQATADDTMTIGTKEYTFVADGSEADDGDISVGTDLATCQANIVAAINGTDTINTANTFASAGAFAANDSTITALVGGTVGDAIATTETFTAATNVFAAATLGSGADCSAANAITALVAAEVTGATYTLADSTGDTMTVTYNTKGVIGNSVATTETFTTASNVFDAATLGTTTAGVNGTIAENGTCFIDNTYLYYCIDDNTIADNYWRRIALGSAY